MSSTFSCVGLVACVGLAALTAGCGSSSDGNGSGSNTGAPPGSPGAAASSSSSSSSSSSGGTSASSSSGGASSSSSSSTSSSSGGTSGSTTLPPTDPQSGPPAGNPTGTAIIPAEGQPEDVSTPTTVVGTGTAASCTPDAFVAAVAKGGVITFNCGAAPTTIVLTSTAKVFNNTAPKLVIDGGNKVTLSGGGKIRILYMSTCDKAQVYPSGSGDCNTNAGVQLVLQNITFIDGNSKAIPEGDNNGGGGGAVYAQGGSLKVVNSRFFNNVCADLGSDLGGGAIRKLDYLIAPGAGPARPVWIVHSTFGGAANFGNSCANGGALSSIGVSWNILNTLLSNNTAVGHGANDGQGGNGGAIYNDGNEIVMNVTSSVLQDNVANEGGSAIFFVSNNKTGSITIKDSLTQRNPRGTFETFFGFYVIAKQDATIINSQILR